MKILLSFLFLFSAYLVVAQPAAKRSLKILFVPLDDRPPCLQFTERMGMIGNADVIAPPKEMIGRFTTAGQSDQIIEWVKKQDLQSFDAAIISLDMLVYGGLVASRVHNVNTTVALKRIEMMKDLRRKAPRLRIYAQSVIMRLAPTSDGKNETYRADLAKWAEISVNKDAGSRAETSLLETKIPADALAGYKTARQRNLAVNLKAVDFVRSGVIDYLILSQDDAKPVGIHVADREKLVAETKRLKLQERVAVQPGADEVSMLLLARALNHFYRLSPSVKAVFSSDIAANSVMPFEDKPLKETVSYHIRATGSRQVEEEQDADLLFYIFASRNETGRAKTFAAEIESKLRAGRRVMVADIDPVGNVQGGDSAFTVELGNRGLLPELNSYASWNTAANTIGTTLPHGIVFHIATRKLLQDTTIASRIWTAQNWFTFHRVLDDYYFHGLQRSRINKYFDQDRVSSRTLDAQKNKEVENYAMQLLTRSFAELTQMYERKLQGSRQQHVTCNQPSGFTFRLPWNRTFEAEIDFEMSCNSEPRF
jgi:hypothetical protein